MTAYKVAAIMYASDELVEDANVDIVKFVIDLFADAIAEEEDRVITQGSGTGQPTGLTNCTISSTTCSGNLDFDNIIDLIYSLPSQYRKNAKFLVNNVNIKELRKVKDGNNRYIWNDPQAPNQPATIHGFPVIENSWVGEDEIYFGDFKQGFLAKVPFSRKVKSKLRKLKETLRNFFKTIFSETSKEGRSTTIIGESLKGLWNGLNLLVIVRSKNIKTCDNIIDWLGDRRQMTVTVSNVAGTAWEKDQTGIRVVERIAGNCVLEDAMRKLVSIP